MSHDSGSIKIEAYNNG